MQTLYHHENIESYLLEKMKQYSVLVKQKNLDLFGVGSEKEIYEFDEDKIQWSIPYCIHNLNYFLNEIGQVENEAVAKLVNAFFKFLELIVLEEHKAKFAEKDAISPTLYQLFQDKLITRPQVKQILDYHRKTYYRYKLLYTKCIHGQEKHYKKVTLF